MEGIDPDTMTRAELIETLVEYGWHREVIEGESTYGLRLLLEDGPLKGRAPRDFEFYTWTCPLCSVVGPAGGRTGTGAHEMSSARGPMPGRSVPLPGQFVAGVTIADALPPNSDVEQQCRDDLRRLDEMRRECGGVAAQFDDTVAQVAKAFAISSSAVERLMMHVIDAYGDLSRVEDQDQP